MENSTCKNTPFTLHQGILKLDQPYKKPSKSALSFSLCQQYQRCSCCNASHALAIHRSLQSTDAEPMSDGCYAITAQMACRSCDPEVGMGLKDRVCTHTCQNWLNACQHDYFSYNAMSQSLEPCGTGAASAVCSQASQLARNGVEFCSMAGLHAFHEDHAEANIDCFDGSNVPLYDSCNKQPQKTAARTPATSSQLAVPRLFWLFAVMVVSFFLYIQVKRIVFRMSSQHNAPKGPPIKEKSPYFRGKGRRLQRLA